MSNNFIGDVTNPKFSCKVKFSVQELDDLKQYATDKGYVYIDVVMSTDKERFSRGNIWCKPYDPRADEGRQERQTQSRAADQVPF